MKHLLLTAGALVTTLAGALAATPEKAAAPAAQPAPFVVDSCRAEYAGGWLVKSISGLRIKFTNEGDKAASVVRIAVLFDKNIISVRDVGSFAPNITINHVFRDLSGQNMKFGLSHEDQPSSCKIQFVKFADGTMWAPSDESEAQADPSPTASASDLASPEASASASAKPTTKPF